MSSSDGSVTSFQTFLRQNHLTFACAESCTGGLLSREMTEPAGSSDVFWGGVVTYSDEAKNRLLQVPADLIVKDGAVSGAVAAAMVHGLLQTSGVPLAVSITGVAGPGGGTAQKPVGTVWFGLGSRKHSSKVSAVLVRLTGTRGQIQSEAARLARVLARNWWESDMDLDSLRSLADNDGKSVIVAFQPPSSNPSDPL